MHGGMKTSTPVSAEAMRSGKKTAKATRHKFSDKFARVLLIPSRRHLCHLCYSIQNRIKESHRKMRLENVTQKKNREEFFLFL